MQFSLLKYPTEIPSRMPLSRGLPSASASAVSAGGVPSSLPLNIPRAVPMAEISPDAVALPYQALARFAAVGGTVTSDVSTLVLAAEAKKRDANDTTEIDKLSTDFTQTVDHEYADLKTTETDETLIPAFNAMWKTRTDEIKQQASNPRVAAGLDVKINSLLRAKSGEVTNASTRKFVDRQTGEFNQYITDQVKLATDPRLSESEQQLHQKNLEARFLKEAHTGLIPGDVLQNKRQEALETIKVERAQTKAFVNPMQVLEDMSQGNNYGLDSKQSRTLMDAATTRLKQQRADQEHADNLAKQDRKDRQNEQTIGLRQQIIQNWEPGGARTSMVNLINTNARQIGDENYRSLLETERIYQALATKPGPKKQSDSAVVGELQAKLTSERWREVTQDDLLRLLKNDVLDDGDHRYLSNKLDELTQAAKKPQPETEAQKQRKKDIDEAAKTIETFIERGNKFDRGKSLIQARDAVVELHRQAAANPDLHPDQIATKLIAQKMAQFEDLRDGLPYQTREDVVEAYSKGLILRNEAERYFAIFDLVGQNTPPKKDTPTPEPGFFQQHFPSVFGTKPVDPTIRQPQKRKIP